MADSDTIWSVDRLAANGLLAALDLEVTAESLAMVAAHFSMHRIAAHEWAAERAQEVTVRKLETVSQSSFERRSDDWANGFRAAEAQVLSITCEELLGRPGRSRSAGQILRSLVSQAKRKGEMRQQR